MPDASYTSANVYVRAIFDKLTRPKKPKVIRDKMIDGLNKVKKIATLSKLERLLHNPYKYCFAIAYRLLVYPRNKKEQLIETNLFYGKKMVLTLPASTDIYLTGGKSHSSEIRLALFLILNLKEGNGFVDIGAHYGYFTLIAAELVGSKGNIYSFEPSNKNSKVLMQNANDLPQVTVCKKAVSDTTENIVFYEFDTLQSEYNSLDIAQFEQEEWFKNYPPSKVEVACTTIDTLTQQITFIPHIIKIDVEGAEYNAINGGANFLKSNAPIVIMEYVEAKRNNVSHKKALDLLRAMGYASHIINDDGTLDKIHDIDEHLNIQNLDSDNIVFLKTA